jgi:outer membrane protein TolC
LGAALVAAALAAAGAARAQTAPPIRSLGEAYRAALAASESIGIDEQSIRQAEELYRQTIGDSLPELSGRSVTSWTGGPRGAFSTGRMSQTDIGVRVAQTNLSFYKELAAVRRAKSGVRVQEEDLLRAKQLLLVSLAGAFYGQLQAQENVQASSRLREFAAKRLTKLHEWVRVGRSRQADALAQDSQIASLESQREESARQAAADSDLLAFLTKASVEPATADTPIAAPPKALEDYLARAETRPDVKAARWAADFAQAGVSVAQGDRLPQVSYFADWYASRPDAKMNSRWDAQLALSLPLFTFGSLRAGVAQARAAATAADLTLQQARRSAELDIRNAYRNDMSARRQLDIQKNAVALAEKDFDLQRQDESRGLVTAIDVLQSLDRLNSARLAYTNALLNARLAAIQLEVSAGARPEDMDLR